MSKPRILIAGVGNIFFGDDAFGCEVAKELSSRPLPNDVAVVDFGIRGLDLAYAMLEQPEIVLIIDATPRGGQPGTLYRIEPEIDGKSALPESNWIDTHGMDIASVLKFVVDLGGQLPRLVIVGCEPEPSAGDDDFGRQLSDAIKAAVPAAASFVEEQVGKLLAETGCSI